MRTALFAAALAWAVGGAAAYGQEAHTGGTCSGHAASCRNACANVQLKAGGCASICEEKRAACMQTGTFVARSVTFTNVTRQ